MKELFSIKHRRPLVINTDPQRRCYNGCNFSEETVCSEWRVFGRYNREDGESSIAFFKTINPTHEYLLVPYNPEAF